VTGRESTHIDTAFMGLTSSDGVTVDCKLPARSDAINLAVLAGVPIRVDVAILDDPVVDSHPEWEGYPARLADLAAEERQRRADFQARLAQEHEGPGRP
jgi:bifunctional DNase/RNase